jgi:large subunit ribosomal protein L22
MSAVANAENNHDLDVNALIVSEAYVGKNLVMKRFAARGRGRGFSIMKPFSQITVVVRETEAEAEKPKAKKAKGKEAADKKGKPAKAVAKKPAAKAKSAAAAEKEAE